MDKNKNRLNLNWELSTKEERTNFAYQYLDTLAFTPTSEELDMIGKYILWGKSAETGLNGRQEGLDLPTRAGTWDVQRVESLDALMEAPTFNEAILRDSSEPVYRTPKIQFSRAEARAKSTPLILAELETLWRQIDETEFLITSYELQHNKRTLPMREPLLKRISQPVQSTLEKRASTLKPQTYLKLKHLLVELRRQQFTLKDSYNEPLLLQPTFNTFSAPSLLWGEDITIAPLNIPGANELSALIFRTDRFPEPSDFNETQLQALSKLLQKPPSPSARQTFDFTNPTHLEQFIGLYLDLQSHATEVEISERSLDLPIRIFESYRALAPLKDFQQDILRLKIQHKSNEQIGTFIYEKYGKKYTLNQISTLFHQTILVQIAHTAARHREIIENLFQPENFKTCIDCGKTLLRDNENFMRRSKVKDGYSPRCKCCEKILRDRRKNS